MKKNSQNATFFLTFAYLLVMLSLNDKERFERYVCNLPYRDASNSWTVLYRSSSSERPIGFSFESWGNQHRYIWTAESRCNGSVLGDWETKNELSVHENQHLDMPLILGIDRNAEMLAHGEKVGTDCPLSPVTGNTEMSTTIHWSRQRSDSWQGVALSLTQLIKAVI